MSSSFALWDGLGLGAVALALIVFGLGLGLGLECSGLVNTTVNNRGVARNLIWVGINVN